jgi:NAD(P)-dependent dehydrogenase (short-subunit alcohol dehydrogenase family)
MMSGEFSERVAFVTGGASGIGLAVCRLLAAAGASVVVADLDGGSAEAVARSLGSSVGLAVDVTDPDSVRAGVGSTVERFGALHLAVNNAGITGPIGQLHEYDVADWRRVMAVNLDGVFHSLHYELPAIVAAGGGAVVNMASALGVVGAAGGAAYVAAKHGVVGLTRAAALEYAAQGVRVNAVVPGFIDTAMLDPLSQGTRTALRRLHPAGRLGTADEVAQLIGFLLSERASFIHGSVHPVDGGYTAQ